MLDEEKETVVEETKKEKEEEKREELEETLENMDLKDMLFDHEFYEKFKDEGNLKLIRSFAKRKKK